MQEVQEMKRAYQQSGLAPKKDDAAPANPAALQGFWKFAVLFSFAVNAVLVLVLLMLAGLVFEIRNGIAKPLIGGLYENFVLMDQARIISTIPVNTTIQVNDTIPVVFDLPLSAGTVVTLTRPTLIPNTTVYLNGLPVPTDIVLPQGTPLEIQLDLSVPVSQTVPVVLPVPVNLQVAVDIPLNQTELHQPFTSLAALVSPYNALLDKTPSGWRNLFGGR